MYVNSVHAGRCSGYHHCRHFHHHHHHHHVPQTNLKSRENMYQCDVNHREVLTATCNKASHTLHWLRNAFVQCVTIASRLVV